jgi:hypothetical protein
MSGGTVSENRQAAMRGARPGGEPFAELCRKVVVLITEDWFALSHFRPLIGLLKEIAREVVVVTRSSGRLGEIEALGVRVIDFDYRRSSSNPAREAASAWALARILEAEAPDVVHLVAMKPVILGGLALKLVPCPPRGRAHDRARAARLRHGRAAAALPRRGRCA